MRNFKTSCAGFVGDFHLGGGSRIQKPGVWEEMEASTFLSGSTPFGASMTRARKPGFLPPETKELSRPLVLPGEAHGEHIQLAFQVGQHEFGTGAFCHMHVERLRRTGMRGAQHGGGVTQVGHTFI